MIKKASLLFVALCVVSSVSVSVARAEGGDFHDRMMIPPPGMFGGHGNGQDDNEGSDNGPHAFGEHGSSSRPRMHNPNASSTNWNHEEGDGHHGSSTRDHDGSMHNGSSTGDGDTWMHNGSSTGDMPPTQGIVSSLQSMTQDQMQSLLALLMKLIALLQQR